MRALVLRADDLADERRRTGADRWDEVWDGVLHMPPPPSGEHQHFGTRLLASLLPVAERLELRMAYETGLFRPGRADDYRVPDLIVAPPSSWTRRGVEGPSSFVVEILSEDDESYDKLPFYAELQVAELFLVDPTDRTFELYVLRAGVLRLVQADDAGVVRSASLGVSFSTVDGPRLRIDGPAGRLDL